MTTETITDAPPRAGVAPWVSRVADTQLKQVILSGDVVAVMRSTLDSCRDRSLFLLAATSYTRLAKEAAVDLGALDRIEMTSRLGPVFAGQARHNAGAKTLTEVLTAALLHAALDDLRPRMRSQLAVAHDRLTRRVAQLNTISDQLADPARQRVAMGLAADWKGTLAELADTVTAIA